MIGPGGLFKTIFNALRTTTIQEEQFILGNTFSYEDYMTYEASESKYFYLDCSEFDKDNLVFVPPAYAATSGPVTVEYFANPTVDAPGTILGVSNRRGTSENVNKVILSNPLNENVSSEGTRFTGRLVPASGTAPANSVGSESSANLPFELNPAVNYLLKITNENGAGVKIQTDLTWFEAEA